MALDISVVGTTGIDESGGDQNNALTFDTKHDIASFPAGIEAVFAAEITQSVFDTAIELAGGGGNDVTLTDSGSVTGLSLTDDGGALLSGEGTGDYTLGGDQIFLYTDTTNANIVYGLAGNGDTADPNGDLVYMVYLEETLTGSDITGGIFWTALFEPLAHTDTGDPDDIIDLTGHVYVTAEETLNFSFEGAPSGENVFMAFGNSPGIAIIATGEAFGEGVNSGQGSNNPNFPDDKTALGVNSQDIGDGEKLYFTYVTDMDLEYLVPDLTAPEASTDANIQFGDVFGSDGASFSVVKVTGGGPTASVDVRLEASNTENLASGNLEKGTDWFPGLADDLSVNITSVQVNGVDSTDAAATFTVTGLDTGSVLIEGVIENDRISYTTDGDHNRISIENAVGETATPDNRAFSIASFGLTSTGTVMAEAGFALDFFDDGPSEGASDDPLVVFEDALSGGNPDLDLETEVVKDTTDISGILNSGTDAPGLEFGAIASLDGTSILTDSGVSVLLEVNPDYIGGSGDTDQIIGSVGGTDVFEILIDPDGTLSFEVLSVFDHSGIVGVDREEVDEGIDLGGLFEAFDEDGDRATFSDDAVSVLIENDAPILDLTDLNALLQTDDGDLAGGNEGDGTGTDTDTDGDGVLFSLTSNLPGADGGDGNGVVYTLELGGTTTTTLVDTATGHTVDLVDNGGTIEGRTQTSNELVFTLSVAGNGDVTLTQLRAVVHSTMDTASPYDGDTTGLGVTDAVWLRGTITDGDTDTATDAIDLSNNLSFTDDGPAVTVNDTSGYYDVGAQGIWNDLDGADGFQSYDVTLLGYEIDAEGVIDVNAALAKDGPYSFSGAITDDFNGDDVDETVDFTLIFNPVGDTYDLQVSTPPGGITEISTADGSIPAGGPDPVQTLVIGTENIVFSAVDPLTTAGTIESFLNENEAYIELNGTGHLSDDEMNVSTAGIGNDNNNFDGNANDGVDGATTNGGKVDESFVVDPTDLAVSSVKVFIDNAVGGYDNPPEDLWYRVYYTDGTPTTGLIEVTELDLSPEAKGQMSFLIGDRLGDNNIDAVQLFMGEGTVKIPVIEFSTTTVFDPESLSLDLSATLTDGDDDTATETLFTIDLDPAIA